MKALIDADSLVYVIGWNYKDAGSTEEVRQSCDNFLRDIMTITQATEYIGVFSPPSSQTFRMDTYKYAQYKAGRPEKPEFLVKWEDIIKDWYKNKHGFFTAEDLEADDVVASIGYGNPKCIICSPDKDLKQVPGIHYDYKKEGAQVEVVSDSEAYWNFWMQMLTGDSTDNVAGVPGLGEVKAKKLLETLMKEDDQIQAASTVKGAYIKYFGGYYGPIIYGETLMTLRLMTSQHPLYSAYAERIKGYASTHTRTLAVGKGIFDVTE